MPQFSDITQGGVTLHSGYTKYILAQEHITILSQNIYNWLLVDLLTPNVNLD